MTNRRVTNGEVAEEVKRLASNINCLTRAIMGDVDDPGFRGLNERMHDMEDALSTRVDENTKRTKANQANIEKMSRLPLLQSWVQGIIIAVFGLFATINAMVNWDLIGEIIKNRLLK